SDGGADESPAGEVQVAQDFGRTSFRDDQAVVWLHALFAQGAGESTDGVESDDAGLQPQTGAEPGELRQIDGGGGRKKAANGLKWAGEALFSFSGPRIFLRRYPDPFDLYPTKNRRPELLDHRHIFFHPSRQSFYTASRFVRPRFHPSKPSSQQNSQRLSK